MQVNRGAWTLSDTKERQRRPTLLGRVLLLFYTRNLTYMDLYDYLGRLGAASAFALPSRHNKLVLI